MYYYFGTHFGTRKAKKGKKTPKIAFFEVDQSIRKPLFYKGLRSNGADEENRTPVVSLEG